MQAPIYLFIYFENLQIQDTDEVRTQQTKGVAMPFNINNVDVTVASNAVFGITMVAVTNVSSDPLALIDAEIEVFYHTVFIQNVSNLTRKNTCLVIL